MSVSRSLTALGAVTLLACAALAPPPATAGPVVLNANLVCADVSLGGSVPEELVTSSVFGGIVIAQRNASGTGLLQLTGPGNSNLSLTVKMNGLPPSTPAACAAVCVVDGMIDLFDFAAFKPCGTTTAGGKLTFTGTVPFVSSDPFNGGCLLPIPAVWVKPQLVPELLAPVPADPLVVCAPGFGTFPDVCLFCDVVDD